MAKSERDGAAACAHCGGPMVRGTLKAGNTVPTIVVAGVPDDFLGVVPYTTSPVEARVCTACGHIALFATSLDRVLQMGGGGDEESAPRQ